MKRSPLAFRRWPEGTCMERQGRDWIVHYPAKGVPAGIRRDIRMRDRRRLRVLRALGIAVYIGPLGGKR